MSGLVEGAASVDEALEARRRVEAVDDSLGAVGLVAGVETVGLQVVFASAGLSGGSGIDGRGEKRAGGDDVAGAVLQNEFNHPALQENMVVAVTAAVLDALNLAHLFGLGGRFVRR